MVAQLPIVPLLLSLVGALVISVTGFAWPRAAWPLAVSSAAAAAVAALAGVVRVITHGTQRYAVGGWPPPWGIEVVLDPLSAFTASVVAGVAAIALLTAGPAVRRAHGGPGGSVFFALALVALTGFLGIIASGDFFNVFVFLEIAAIASYALVGSGGGPALAAAFRYIVLGTVGASFYLLGVGLLYSVTGSLNMADVATVARPPAGSSVVVAAVVFMLVGLGIKMALFPLHGWLPDAYTHAPPAVTAFLAGVATKAAAYALARILLYVLKPGELPVATVLSWMGAAAILVGGVMAARQVDARRLLAYSSVSQLGYVALGFGIPNIAALTGAYLHVLNHAVMKSALFIAVGAALLGGRGPRLADLRLGQGMPLTASCAVIVAASMVGIPPAGGFFSKWYLLQGAVEAGAPLFVATILIGSLLAAVYMYRLTEAVWFAAFRSDSVSREAPLSMLAGLILLAALTLVLGVGNSAIVERVLIPATAGVF